MAVTRRSQYVSKFFQILVLTIYFFTMVGSREGWKDFLPDHFATSSIQKDSVWVPEQLSCGQLMATHSNSSMLNNIMNIWLSLSRTTENASSPFTGATGVMKDQVHELEVVGSIFPTPVFFFLISGFHSGTSFYGSIFAF